VLFFEAVGEKICITGMSGLLGSIVQNRLSDSCDLTALNRRRVPGVRSVSADISSSESIGEAFRGQDVIIHLAAYPFADNNWEEILRTNIVGMYNVLQAACEAKVGRFVFASSLSVLGGHMGRLKDFYRKRKAYSRKEKTAFLESLGYPRVDSLYGASKVWGETLCRLYVDRHSMSCVCLRLAEVRREDVPDGSDPLGPAKWCSHEDFLDAVQRAIELTRKPGFRTINVISGDK
jgi:nucleoside-diphosphate-sugar epimerase